MPPFTSRLSRLHGCASDRSPADPVHPTTSPTTAPEVTLSFKDITLDVLTGLPGSGDTSSKKRILHGISGSVRPGELMAIMGPSGAGKSSLINILSAHTPTDHGGTVLLNGAPRRKAMKRLIAYVTQSDLFLPMLTVRETLTFSALLRLPSTLTLEQKRRRVDRVIRMLVLGKSADTKVGGMMMRGISGGERRRLNIGCEILTNPSLLLADEPTSGLDSGTAHAVVETLADMAHSGRAVACSIHQASSAMARNFDSLLLLAEGRTIYYGPMAAAAGYFEREGFPCPRYANICDHVLELVTAEQLHGGDEKIVPLAEAYQRHAAAEAEEAAEAAEAKTEADRFAAGDSAAALVAPEGESRWAVPFAVQFRVLLHRAFLQTRGERITKLNFFQILAISFIMGLVWFDMGRSEKEIQNRLGAVFFLTVFFCFQGLFNALTSFPPERPVISKERAAGSYRLSAYFISRAVSALPVDALFPTVLLCISYGMMGLNENFGRFVAMWAAIQLTQLSVGGLGLLISCVTMDFKKSLVVASVTMLGFMLTGGFYSREDTMPDFISWVQLVSPVKYAYSLTAMIELRDERWRCDSPSAFESCELGGAGFIPGEAILARDNLDELSPTGNAAVLFALGVVTRYLAYLALRRK